MGRGDRWSARGDERPGTWTDAGTVQISGNKMVRTFFTYPADAPIETTATYFRPGLD